MSNLHRTQIYINEEQMHHLKLEAGKEQLTVSELIRKAIDYFLKVRAKNIDWDKDPITKSVGKLKLKVDNASEKHDHLLYRCYIFFNNQIS